MTWPTWRGRRLTSLSGGLDIEAYEREHLTTIAKSPSPLLDPTFGTDNRRGETSVQIEATYHPAFK